MRELRNLRVEGVIATILEKQSLKAANRQHRGCASMFKKNGDTVFDHFVSIRVLNVRFDRLALLHMKIPGTSK